MRKNETTKFVYITIRLKLYEDLDEIGVQDLVETVDYEVKDPKRRIEQTDMVSFSTKDTKE